VGQPLGLPLHASKILTMQKNADDDLTISTDTESEKKSLIELLYQDWIKITIPRSDVIAVYRALSDTSKILLRL